MLLASVKGVSATRTRAGVGAGAGTGGGPAPGPAAPPAAGESDSSPTPGEPPSEPPTATAAVAGGSLFDDDGGSLFGDAEKQAGDQAGKPQATEAKSEVEGTQGAEGKLGGSLFGDGASLFDTPVEEETRHQAEPERASQETDSEERPTDSKAETRTGAEPALGSQIPEGTSLFDLGEPEAARAPTTAPAAEATDWEVGHDIPEGQSLFDVDRPDPETILDADDEPEPQPEPESESE
jgi:hypothetical protein